MQEAERQVKSCREAVAAAAAARAQQAQAQAQAKAAAAHGAKAQQNGRTAPGVKSGGPMSHMKFACAMMQVIDGESIRS